MCAQNSLNINISQQLFVSDHLQQAIKLLQLSSIELDAVVKLELQKNPLLLSSDEDEDEDHKKHELYYNKISKQYGEHDNFADNISNKTLREHILEQINLDIDDPQDRMIAINIADLLSDAGYIDEHDLTQLAIRIKTPLASLHKILKIMQKFDPSGIFARNLAECLILQLEDLGKINPQYLLLINLNLM